MFSDKCCRRRASIASLLFAFVIAATGCGFERLQPTLPDAVAGFTLADLEDIQNDERLTDDEKRAAIRAAIDAPDTPEGDRLVEFLLDLNVP